ncbi:transcriptional regulator NanR [Aliihoeflea aestuarii]|jgi:GntR family transcriptional regulator, sialic acid-inducible nan operon repressor|uniref:transcriptional regulator NanR n=1 Tax=Aliihoeflea aestuarii TaxID=453840 RepID=UPI00209229B1|nr:transcriptional regulator NanR [Aliihoeflea aestuarii]MCO6391799.1 transcriptional regulator NanR [Aliihoeflea aestuarii]
MEPVQKRKLYEDVLDRLITAISTAEFPPGSQLPSERELMNMIGVGRPSIREAMLSLQQMGLIKISHGERARVINPTPDVIVGQISAAMIMLLATSPRGLEELKEARLWLETGLVRMATRNATAKDLEKLGESLRELQEARGDHQRFVTADMAFHGLIADMSGNSLVAAVTKGMLHWLSRFKRELVSVRGAERLTISEHEKIYKAIVGGDGEAASSIMGEHITRGNRLYWQLAGSNDGTADIPLASGRGVDADAN